MIKNWRSKCIGYLVDMKKQESKESEEKTKNIKPQINPQPSTSRTQLDSEPASTSTSSSTAAASSAGASAAPIDFGDASHYDEVSPIGTGDENRKNIHF